MGEGYKQTLRVSFDARVKLAFHGSKVTSDTGCLLTANWMGHWN